MNKYIPLIILGVLLNACAQITIKQGMRTIGLFSFSMANIIPVGIKVALSPFIIAGLFCYAISVVVWLLVLSRVEVTYAYPFLSVGYIVTAIAGYMFLGENMECTRWVGIFIICIGVYLITKTV